MFVQDIKKHVFFSLPSSLFPASPGNVYLSLQTIPVDLSSDLNSLLKSEENAHSILNIESSLIALLPHLSRDKYFISIP